MRVSAQIEIAAPPEDVWEFVVDPARQLHFMAGMTRWEVEGEQATGMGARYRTLMRVGSAEVGGLVEVVEFQEPGDMAWTSVLGLDQRGRWRLRDHGPNRTSVMFRLSYHAPGGLLGWLSDQLSAPMVRNNIHHALENLKRHIESEGAEEARGARSKAAKRRAAPA
jgi:uncharacterized membrane protein